MGSWAAQPGAMECAASACSCSSTGQRDLVETLDPEPSLSIQAKVRRYILANVEHTTGVRRGDRLWQLGFGGGFKANSAVWRARRIIHSEHACWL